jgi:RNA polymerase sigma-70 factor, ECF subfamily
MKCVTEAWIQHETELRNYLRGQVYGDALAADLLQDTFLTALSQGGRFCQIDNVRAWLFRVAKNRLIDFRRTHKKFIDTPENQAQTQERTESVAGLAQCLPRALAELSEQDAEIIRRCDLEGMTQTEYANHKGISVEGAKSRVQRARKRLKQHLQTVCQVRYDDTGKVCCFVPRSSDINSIGK